MNNGPEWFQGTADSVYQNIHLIESFQPDIVAVFGADHIYRMDVRQMVDFHRASRAHVSVATLPVPLSQCNQFGIVEVDTHQRIGNFVEKPQSTRPMPGSRTHALASMGNYLFNADVLLDALKKAHATGHHDFGRDILPTMLRSLRLMACDFTTNEVPGTAAYEEHAYWRDVGTIDAYFDAHFDTLGGTPRFRMTNLEWPIYASSEQAESAQIEEGTVRRSIVGSGCVVDGANLDHAMLRRSVMVERDAQLEHCIVMERSRIGRGAHGRRAIIDQDNDIPQGERIGFDPERDRERFLVTENGVVVVPRRFFTGQGSHPSDSGSEGTGAVLPNLELRGGEAVPAEPF
jgi:glucose-1-phosphate adenylyltransferase